MNRPAPFRLSTLLLAACPVLSLLLLGCGKPAPVVSAPTRADVQTQTRVLGLEAFLAKVQQSASAVAAGRTIRLAVIPLRPTESPRYADQGFGAFLTERIGSSLGSPGSSVRLFERSRLDAVLQEQKLSASGLFDESQAKRLGELAPIDALLTGTFTRLESAAAIHLRIIDVVSGEVRGQVSEQVALTPDLAALFRDLQYPQPPPAPPAAAKAAGPGGASPCDPRWAPVRAAMEDIGTPERLDRLVDAATAIPFEGPCGMIHARVIAHLLRYKRHSDRYGEFLLRTLQAIERPDEDDRDREIARYLLVPGQLEDPAWNALLRLAQRSRQHHLYLEWLLADRMGSQLSRKRLQERIGILLREAEQKRLGKPVPVETARFFTEILEHLRGEFLGSYAEAKDLKPLMICYRTHAPHYAGDSDKRLLEILLAMHEACTLPADRDEVTGWIGAAVQRFTPSRDLADAIARFMDRLLEARAKARRQDPSGGPAARDLRRLAQACGNRLAQTLPFIQGREYRLNLTGFCLEHGIRAAEVPTLETLLQQFASEDATEQKEAVRLLKALGPGAIPAEPLVLKKLRRLDHLGSHQGDRHLQRELLGLLGTLQTRNPEAIQVLVAHLSDLESYTADAAIESLASLGDPAVPALKAEFPRLPEPYKRIRLLKVFRMRGRAASAHLPWIRARLDEEKSPLVRDALEDVIEAAR